MKKCKKLGPVPYRPGTQAGPCMSLRAHPPIRLLRPRMNAAHFHISHFPLSAKPGSSTAVTAHFLAQT